MLSKLFGSRTKVAAIAGIIAMLLKSFTDYDVPADAIEGIIAHVEEIIAFVGLWFLRDTPKLN